MENFRKNKIEPEDDSGIDVFSQNENVEELKEECLLVDPKFLKEEEDLKKEGDEEYAKEIQKGKIHKPCGQFFVVDF